jgi:hypothetical protein
MRHTISISSSPSTNDGIGPIAWGGSEQNADVGVHTALRADHDVRKYCIDSSRFLGVSDSQSANSFALPVEFSVVRMMEGGE